MQQHSSRLNDSKTIDNIKCCIQQPFYLQVFTFKFKKQLIGIKL